MELDTAPIRGRVWLAKLTAYREPSLRRSIIEMLVTGTPLVLLWVAAWAALSVSYWLTLALCVPAACFLVRMFLIQHDCGHGSFFRRKATNDWVGRAIGVLTLTPYDVWRRSHAIHHATSGSLERRGVGDIDTLTVREYRARSWLGRLAYRIYRNPLVMFGIGPVFLFVVQNRLPFGLMRAGWIYWLSAMATNLAIAVAAVLMTMLVGTTSFLMVHLPIIAIASSIGVWLFYVQHQFEHTFWERDPDWDVHDAALLGSSYYDLPPPLGWLTANIGVHHVHHLYSRIPYYRLSDVIRDHPDLGRIRRLTLRDSFACARLRLWDEDNRRLVSFAEARHLR